MPFWFRLVASTVRFSPLAVRGGECRPAFLPSPDEAKAETERSRQCPELATMGTLATEVRGSLLGAFLLVASNLAFNADVVATVRSLN